MPNNCEDFRFHCIDLYEIALQETGKKFVNIAALGAFAAATKEISMESLEKAIEQEFSQKKEIVEASKKLCKKVFEVVKNGKA